MFNKNNKKIKKLNKILNGSINQKEKVLQKIKEQ